jgi:hypothetical protein
MKFLIETTDKRAKEFLEKMAKECEDEYQKQVKSVIFGRRMQPIMPFFVTIHEKGYVFSFPLAIGKLAIFYKGKVKKQLEDVLNKYKVDYSKIEYIGD